MPNRVGLDLGDLLSAVAERTQRMRYCLIDDFEVAAAGKLLELNKREIRLNSSCVTIHDEADRAGRRNHSRLRVSKTMQLAEVDRSIPSPARSLDQARVATSSVIERYRIYTE